jgi:glutathione S-transferase
MKLVIGNQNYSSWSMRPWFLLTHLGIPFEVEKLSFNDPAFGERVRRYSPAGRVPVLVDGELVIWDSLAIVEYLAETFPDRHIWPRGRAARARARSIVAEMHAGFPNLREALSMNCELRMRLPLTRAVRREVDDIVARWTGCRAELGAGGPFLFGEFSAADAYFAPVVRRFVSYGVELPAVATDYVATLEGLPAMRRWLDAALAEDDFVVHDEPYREPPR